MLSRALVSGLVVSLLPLAVGAQPIVKVPDQSPRARVEQTVGVSDFSVWYGRPAVKARKIWGGEVKYDAVWRAGANENTVLSASTEFTVEGKRLPAGKYGVHLLPAERGPWTLVLSKVSSAWGSFGYDPKEDALRVPVTPEAAPHEERLSWAFDDVADDSATLALRWEKLRVPIKLAVDTKELAYQSLRLQLFGIPQFFPKGWTDAGNWLLAHDTHLDEAAQWADKALTIQATFGGAMLKSRILEKKGDAAGAKAMQERAMGLANEVELNQYGYALMGQGKLPEAIAAFRRNVKDHPESWNVHDSLGEALEKAGEKKEAKESYGRALKLVKDEGQKKRIERTLSEM